MAQLATDPGGAPAGTLHKLGVPVPPVAVVFGAIEIGPLSAPVGSIVTWTKSPTFCKEVGFSLLMLFWVYKPVTSEGTITTSVLLGTLICKPVFGVK